MIQLQNANYRYSSTQALDGVTATIAPGIYLLLGENGAGKTTLLSLIAGLRHAVPAVSCTINSVPTAFREPHTLRQVFMMTDVMKFPFSTISEMVQRHAVFYPTFSKEMLDENLAIFGIDANTPIDRYSLGNRKKAQLAYALALRTPVLLLDEPANGLDIAARSQFTTMLARCVSEEQTVVISTHVVFDFQNIVDGVMMLQHGRLILNMRVWDISSRIAFVSDIAPIPEALFMQPGISTFNAIVANDGTLTTDIDFPLLYTALQSPVATNLLNILNTPNQ